MALETVALWVANGAEHSADLTRVLNYAATSGGNGVISAGDFQVKALPTPGGSVRVYPGAAVARNRYAGGSNQSYIIRNASSTDVAITPTGSGGGRTDYLIVRVDDPQFGGATPADPKTGPYTRFAVVSSVSNLAYPYVLLAKITIPASTATITQSMIDSGPAVREMANNRRKRNVRAYAVPSSTTLTLTSFATGGEVFIDPWVQTFDIPDWATTLTIQTTVNGIQYLTGDVYGEFWGVLTNAQGTVSTDRTVFDVTGGSGASRMSISAAAQVAVPAAMRGTTASFKVMGRKIGPSSGSATVLAKFGTNVVADLEFVELVSEDMN